MAFFKIVEEKIFFLSFENLYCDTQKLANARQQSLTLTVSQEEVSTDFSAVKLLHRSKLIKLIKSILTKQEAIRPWQN